MFLGTRSPRWVFGFVERCFIHPFAITRAKLRGNPPPRVPTAADDSADTTPWKHWYGWDHVAIKVAENTDMFLAANGSGKGRPKEVWRPPSVTTHARPKTLDDAYGVLMSMMQ